MDADTLLDRMTLEEKVGQLFLLAFEAERIEAAESLFEHFLVGGSYLSNDNLPDPASAALMTRRLQGYAARTRLGIPLLLGADQEGAWCVMYPGSSPGPGNMALGATGDPAHARAIYEVVGRELRAVGVDAPLSPCADCNANPHNVAIGTRSFGERPELVASMTEAAVAGALAAGALPTLKHYPGHGDTTVDSHRGLPTVSRSRDELFSIDLLPFARGVAAGAPIVMTAHILFPALDAERPATLSPVILGDVLRGELGFDGVVLSDSMNMASMRANYDPLEAAVAAINAGVDIVMLAEEHYDHDAGYLARQVALIEGVREAARDGRISEARLDEAVGRVLRLKVGIDVARALDPELVGGPAHRSLELLAARDAVALLRGAGDLIPLPPEGPLTLVNTTRRDAYAILGATRGIGPNQTDAAFDLFAEAVRRRAPGVRVLSAEDVLTGARPSRDGPAVAVTENHPLPGADFDQGSKLDVLRAITEAGERVLVVALRDPYELADLPFVTDYVCAFGPRWCSAEAVAAVVFGETEARGASPVSVPGTDVEAR
ncbi:glycoside hydrolase family 3 protein [soil metagenome]